MAFRRDNKKGGNSDKKYARKSFGGQSSFGGRDGPKPTLHQAICSECNKECEVPFKPSGDKPVFCRKCFKNRTDTSPRESNGAPFGRNNPSLAEARPGGRDFGERSFSRPPMHAPASISKEQFEILNSKLDKILNVLES
ncbi:MAG: CxxC-x17-CxxC domain-containing protein [Patescibacteria group bacterium]